MAIEDFLDLLPAAGKGGPLTLFSHRCRIVCKTMSIMIADKKKLIESIFRIHMMIFLGLVAIENFLDLPAAGKRGPLTLFSHRCRIVCKNMSRMIVADIKFSYRIHI